MSIDTHIYIYYTINFQRVPPLGMNHPGTLATTVPRGCHGSSFPLKPCVTDDAGVNGFTFGKSADENCVRWFFAGSLTRKRGHWPCAPKRTPLAPWHPVVEVAELLIKEMPV